MNKIKNLLIAAVATLALTSSALAFEGFSIGATLSDSTFDTTGVEKKSQGAAASGSSIETSAIQKVSNGVDIGSVFAEYTFAQGSTVGIEVIPGDASLGSKTRTHTITAGQNVCGVITAKANVSDHVTIYVEPTFMLNDKFGVYVKGGAARVTVETQESQTTTTIASTYPNQDVYGVMMGIGAKAYYGNFFAKLESTTTDYGEVSLTSSTGKVINAEIEADATVVSLGYNF